MDSLQTENITVQFDRGGGRNFNKNGLHNWLGKPVLVLSGPYTFYFDLEGRIHRIDGFPSPHSWDWLQRSMANDWIYYDKVWVPKHIPQPSEMIGDSVWAVNGKTDLPFLQDHNGLKREYVEKALNAFDELIPALQNLLIRRPKVYSHSGRPASACDTDKLWAFIQKAARYDREPLQKLADRLHEIRGPMIVLPPDTIRVDYQVLLIKVMDGCTNNCGFCSVRGNSPYALRSAQDIDRQIEAMADVYGSDLYNYNAVVLGECDALAAPSVEYAARRAFDAFQCGSSYHEGSNLFLFATNESLCQQPESTFHMLESLPFDKVYINIGWEAATDPALAKLGKHQTRSEVLQGMEKAGAINRRYRKVTLSGNFISADGFEQESVVDALRRTGYCGQVYLSPLQGRCSPEQALNDLFLIRKARLNVQAHLYTMQRM